MVTNSNKKCETNFFKHKHPITNLSDQSESIYLKNQISKFQVNKTINEARIEVLPKQLKNRNKLVISSLKIAK